MFEAIGILLAGWAIGSLVVFVLGGGEYTPAYLDYLFFAPILLQELSASSEKIYGLWVIYISGIFSVIWVWRAAKHNKAFLTAVSVVRGQSKGREKLILIIVSTFFAYIISTWGLYELIHSRLRISRHISPLSDLGFSLITIPLTLTFIAVFAFVPWTVPKILAQGGFHEKPSGAND